jgi:hypothetical protein
MPAPDTARVTVTFSRDTVLAMRCYLDAQGMREGDLSGFIEDAVRWRMFDSAVQAVKARNADIPPEDLQAAIDEACADGRAIGDLGGPAPRAGLASRGRREPASR